MGGGGDNKGRKGIWGVMELFSALIMEVILQVGVTVRTHSLTTKEARFYYIQITLQ